jgi:hypothetical protein
MSKIISLAITAFLFVAFPAFAGGDPRQTCEDELVKQSPWKAIGRTGEIKFSMSKEGELVAEFRGSGDYRPVIELKVLDTCQVSFVRESEGAKLLYLLKLKNNKLSGEYSGRRDGYIDLAGKPALSPVPMNPAFSWVNGVFKGEDSFSRTLTLKVEGTKVVGTLVNCRRGECYEGPFTGEMVSNDNFKGEATLSRAYRFNFFKTEDGIVHRSRKGNNIVLKRMTLPPSS